MIKFYFLINIAKIFIRSVRRKRDGNAGRIAKEFDLWKKKGGGVWQTKIKQYGKLDLNKKIYNHEKKEI